MGTDEAAGQNRTRRGYDDVIAPDYINVPSWVCEDLQSRSSRMTKAFTRCALGIKIKKNGRWPFLRVLAYALKEANTPG